MNETWDRESGLSPTCPLLSSLLLSLPKTIAGIRCSGSRYGMGENTYCGYSLRHSLEIVGHDGRMKEAAIQIPNNRACQRLWAPHLPHLILLRNHLRGIDDSLRPSDTSELNDCRAADQTEHLVTFHGSPATLNIAESTRLDEVTRWSLPGCRHRDALLRCGYWSGGTKWK